MNLLVFSSSGIGEPCSQPFSPDSEHRRPERLHDRAALHHGEEAGIGAPERARERPLPRLLEALLLAEARERRHPLRVQAALLRPEPASAAIVERGDEEAQRALHARIVARDAEVVVVHEQVHDQVEVALHEDVRAEPFRGAVGKDVVEEAAALRVQQRPLDVDAEPRVGAAPDRVVELRCGRATGDGRRRDEALEVDAGRGGRRIRRARRRRRSFGGASTPHERRDENDVDDGEPPERDRHGLAPAGRPLDRRRVVGLVHGRGEGLRSGSAADSAGADARAGALLDVGAPPYGGGGARRRRRSGATSIPCARPPDGASPTTRNSSERAPVEGRSRRASTICGSTTETVRRSSRLAANSQR